MLNISDLLIEKIQATNNPTVVGLDPRLEMIPEFIRNQAYETYGKNLKGASKALVAFNKALIDNIYDLIPAVKPQIAFYEQFGAEGIAAYIETIEYAKEKGLIIIGDIKRGDIATTAQAYGEGHIGTVDVEGEKFKVFKEDFITVNPYMGSDSISPYLEYCTSQQKGLFILVKTSNKGSGDIQDLLIGEQRIYEKVGQLVEEWGKETIGANDYSALGAVVGATYPEQLDILRKQMPHTFFLVPGYGAQGAGAKEVAGAFDKNGNGAIINSSRGIIAAYKAEKYKSKYSEKEFTEAAREEVIVMRDQLNKVRGL